MNNPAVTADKIEEVMIQLTELMEDLYINRFEYITEEGREVVSYAKHTFQLQDDMRTLKVFREKK